MAEQFQIRGNTWKPKAQDPSLWRGMSGDIEASRQRELEKQEKEREERALIAKLAKERQAKHNATKEAPWEGKRGVDPSRGGSRPPQTLEDLQNFGRPTTKVPPRSTDGTGINWDAVAGSNPEATVQEEPLPVTFVSPQEAVAQDFKEKIANPEVTPDQYEQGATDVPKPMEMLGQGGAIQDFEEIADYAISRANIQKEVDLENAIESGNEGEQMTLDGKPMADALTDDTGAAARGLLDDVDGNLNGMMDEYSTKDILEGKVVSNTEEAIQGGGNNADLEAVASADEGLEDVPEDMGGMMSVEEEQAPIFSDMDQAGYLENIRMKKIINSHLSRIGKGPMGDRGIPRSTLDRIAKEAALEARETGENPVLAIGRALREATMDTFADRETQRQINFDKMIEQQHKSKRWGVPIGLIQAADVIGAARTPEERRTALTQLSVMYPNLGKDVSWDNTRRGVSSQLTGQVAGLSTAETLLGQQYTAELGAAQALMQQGGGEQLPEGDRPIGMQNDLYNGSGDNLSGDNLQKFFQYADNKGFTPERTIEEAAVRWVGSLESVKQKVQAGQMPSIEEAATIRSLLLKVSTNPSQQHFEMLFGPLDQDTYVRLKRMIFAKEDSTWQDWGEGMGKAAKHAIEGVVGASKGVVKGVSGE